MPAMVHKIHGYKYDHQMTKYEILDFRCVIAPLSIKLAAMGKDNAKTAFGNLCYLCGKTFQNVKALHGHMRCHPERQYRGMHILFPTTTTTTLPPPNPNPNPSPNPNPHSTPAHLPAAAAGAGIPSSPVLSPSPSPSPSPTMNYALGWTVKGKRGRRSTTTTNTSVVGKTSRSVPNCIHEYHHHSDDHDNHNHGEGRGSSAEISTLSNYAGGDQICWDTADHDSFAHKKRPRLLLGREVPQLRVSKNSTTDDIAAAAAGPPADQYLQDYAATLSDQEPMRAGATCVKQLDMKPKHNNDHILHECDKCGRSFDSHQALGGHKSSHYIKPKQSNSESGLGSAKMVTSLTMMRGIRKHQCKRCGMSFEKGQSLGGHMRKHWINPPATPAPAAASASADNYNINTSSTAHVDHTAAATANSASGSTTGFAASANSTTTTPSAASDSAAPAAENRTVLHFDLNELPSV
ncbi:hypothetical protein Dimus_014418 [Dionaea muscipula]